jgi:putative ubiquitin-RnfH superfamily antitoxin RatB of RatAB toxin-antitoxin module
MKVSVTYTDQEKQLWLKLEVAEETTVEEAIRQSGILEMVPAIDLDTQKVGIFGKNAKLNKALDEGERVEIYRPIIADPETVERRF